MRIAVIGNSHVPSIKAGWDEMIGADAKNANGVELQYFAAPGRQLWDLKVEPATNDSPALLVTDNEQLLTSIQYSSGGLSQIDVSQFDMVLLHGLLRFPRYDARISSHLKRIILQRLVTSSLANHLAKYIRSYSDIPICATLKPLQVWDNQCYLPAEHTYASYDRVFQDVVNAEFAPDVTIIKQPSVTIENNIATFADYAKSSTRMRIFEEKGNEARVVSDIAHMNADYGILQLQEMHGSTIMDNVA